MSEPFLERLNRFSPDAGRLNRDELLFAAGRSSARPGRGWKMLASALAATQALSLVLLLPPARSLPTGLTVIQATVPAEAPAVENGPVAVDHRSVWLARRNLAELEPEKRPDGDLNLIESGPPLRAFASSRTTLLD
jgi:hypothetical protein